MKRNKTRFGNFKGNKPKQKPRHHNPGGRACGVPLMSGNIFLSQIKMIKDFLQMTLINDHISQNREALDRCAQLAKEQGTAAAAKHLEQETVPEISNRYKTIDQQIVDFCAEVSINRIELAFFCARRLQLFFERWKEDFQKKLVRPDRIKL